MPLTQQELKHVFIGGASRSGTTMLGAMLGSHRKMVATPESQFKFELATIPRVPGDDQQSLIEFLEKNERFRIWNFKPDWKQVNRSSHSTLVNSLVIQYAQKTGKTDITHWIDHTPTNLRHGQFLDTHYAGCRFLHIIRDGRAVMASQLNLNWGSKDPIFSAMKWMEAICVGFACEAAFPKRSLRIQYEKLVLQPEIELERICDFLGINFERGMISGGGFEVPSYTKGQHQLVGKVPDESRVDDWKKKLSTHDIQLFESMTFDLLPMLGYEKQTPGFVPKPKEMKQAWILFRGGLQYLTNKVLKRKVSNRRNA